MFADANDNVRQARYRSRRLRAPCREAHYRCFSSLTLRCRDAACRVMGFTILAPIARLCRSFPTFRRPFPLSRLPVAFPVAFRNEVEKERDTSRPYISKVKFYIVSLQKSSYGMVGNTFRGAFMSAWRVAAVDNLSQGPRLLHQRLANAQGVDGAVGILIDEDALQGETAVVVGVIEVAIGHLITTAHVVAEGLHFTRGVVTMR